MLSLKGLMTRTEKRENKNGSEKSRIEKKDLQKFVQTPIIELGLLKMTHFSKDSILLELRKEAETETACFKKRNRRLQNFPLTHHKK